MFVMVRIIVGAISGAVFGALASTLFVSVLVSIIGPRPESFANLLGWVAVLTVPLGGLLGLVGGAVLAALLGRVRSKMKGVAWGAVIGFALGFLLVLATPLLDSTDTPFSVSLAIAQVGCATVCATLYAWCIHPFLRSQHTNAGVVN